MAGGAFTTLDPKDTYLGLLSLGKDNDVIHATNLTAIQDCSGALSLIEISQAEVAFTGILSATVAAGLVMETGIDFVADVVDTSILRNKDDSDVGIHFTSGDPEGSLVASPGSIALRDDGSLGTTMYVKEAGTSDTGWTAFDIVTNFADLGDCPVIAGGQWLKANVGGTALEFTSPPPTNIVDLDDGPAGYDDGKFLMSGAAGFTLESIPGGTFLELTDVAEPNYTSDKHALVKVNAAENGLAFDAADPDQGDILYFNGSNWTKLPPDTSGKVLITQGVGANPKWDVASAGGSNDPDAVHVDVAGEINALTVKASPSAGDVVLIEDVGAGYAKKKVAMSTLLGNDANAIHDNIAGEITALTEKASPVDDDVVIIEDSEASNAKKKVKFSSIGGGGGGTVPHFDAGTGDFTVIAINGLAGHNNSDGGVSNVYTAWDFVRALRGGAAVPTYSYTFTPAGSGTGGGAGSSDPQDCTWTLDGSESGTVFATLTVSDGTTSIDVGVYISLTDQGGGGP